MSLILAALVGLFLSFFPTVMAVYYKRSTGIILTSLILNLLGFVTMGLTTIIAFIVSAISIGLANTLKSIAFAVFLMFLVFIIGAGELAVIASMIGVI